MISKDGTFLPLLVVQSCGAVIFLAVVVLWPGQWNLARWIGLAITVPAAPLFLASRYQLGQSFAVTPQARELVTGGVYSKIRSPMYLFSALLILGLMLTLQKPYLYPILLVLVPIQIVRAHQEAKVLEEKFGDTYRDYRKKTWF
jgi:protein-S-isoprenylcysteine O-methyltransferase Ste14